MKDDFAEGVGERVVGWEDELSSSAPALSDDEGNTLNGWRGYEGMGRRMGRRRRGGGEKIFIICEGERSCG